MAASRGDASVPFTGATTEFDDVLMKHGIITKEQALLAKGMDVDSQLDHRTILLQRCAAVEDRSYSDKDIRIAPRHCPHAAHLP